MNIEKLEQVRDWLLAGVPERTFNMAVFIDDTPGKDNWCGTACCIAGYVISTELTIDEWRVGCKSDSYRAQELLGLTMSQADRLFYVTDKETGASFRPPWSAITPTQAAQAVQNMIDYADPLWPSILGKENFY